jgi:Protein of unknown function (DUF935)
VGGFLASAAKPQEHSEAEWDDYYASRSHVAAKDERSALVTAAYRSGVFVELPTIGVAEWTPESVQAALRMPEAGPLMRPADLVESMWADDRVQGVLSTRTLGLLGLPLQFFGDPSMVDELRGTEALGGAPGSPGDFFRMHPVSELSKLLMWGIMLGVGLAERIPDDERPIGSRSVPTLKVWHPRWLRYQWVDNSWHLTTAEGEIELDLNSGRWILYLPYGSHRPWAQGAWRACAWPWILKQYALRDRARHSEVLGSAARVGVAPQDADEQKRRSFLSQIRNMGRDTATVLPQGFDLKYVEAQSTSRGEIYSTQIEWADRAIAITLAGQAVTTEGTTGFSNGNIHDQIRRDLIQFTAESLADCLYNGALIHWANDNHGTTDAPFVRWDCSPPEDKAALATAYTALGTAITGLDPSLAAVGQAVDSIALCSKFGIPLRDLAAAPAAVQAPEPAPNDPEAPDAGEPGFDVADEPVAPPTDAARLAAEMTEHGLASCEHGRKNSCPLCGVERTRGVVPPTEPGASPTWRVGWQAIGGSLPPGASAPAAMTMSLLASNRPPARTPARRAA